MRLKLLCLVALLPFLGSAQTDTTSIRIVHGSACDTLITQKQMDALPHRTATIRSHDGEEATYEGAWLQDILALSCTSIAAIDKRTRVRCAVRVSAADGYVALVALTEADSTFRDRPVLICWKRNGQPLDNHGGPFQLIIPDDNRHARDVRSVNRLEVIAP